MFQVNAEMKDSVNDTWSLFLFDRWLDLNVI